MGKRKALVAALVAFDMVLTLSFAVFAAGTGGATVPLAAQQLQPGSFYCTLSASTSGSTATFTGTIYGNLGIPTWTLHFGDGSSTTGSGTAVSGMETYSQAGTYYPYLNATDNQIPASTSCPSNPVVIGRQLSLGVEETMNVGDNVVLVPPLYVNEMVNVLDAVRLVPPLTVLENFTISELIQRLVTFPSLLVNETIGVGDSNTGPVPPGVGESAKFSDQVSITQGSNNPFGAFPGGVAGIIAVGAGAAVAVLAIVWKFFLPRRLS
jgi:hypothetical protein